MKKSTLEQWFNRSEEHVDALISATSLSSAMQYHLVQEGFPATEMKELYAAIQKVEGLLLELKMTVVMASEDK